LQKIAVPPYKTDFSPSRLPQEQRAVESEIKRLELEREAAELKLMQGHERSQRKIDSIVKTQELERERQEREVMMGVEEQQTRVEDKKRDNRHKRSRLGRKIAQSVLCTTCAESRLLAYLQEHCEAHETNALARLGKKNKSDVTIDAGEAMIRRKKEKKRFEDLMVHCRLRKDLGSHIRSGKIEASEMFHVVVDEFESGLRMRVGTTEITDKESNAIVDPTWLLQSEPSPETIEPGSGHPIVPTQDAGSKDQLVGMSKVQNPKKGHAKSLWKRGMKKTNRELYSAILQDDPNNCVVSGKLALLLLENGDEGFLPLLKQAVVDEIQRVKAEEERFKKEDENARQLEKLKKKFAKQGGGGAAGVIAARAKLKAAKSKEGGTTKEKPKKGQKRLRQAAAKKGKALHKNKQNAAAVVVQDDKEERVAADDDKEDVDATADKEDESQSLGDKPPDVDQKSESKDGAGKDRSGDKKDDLKSDDRDPQKAKGMPKGLMAFGNGGAVASKGISKGLMAFGSGGIVASSH
jgi:hypothetical protein